MPIHVPFNESAPELLSYIRIEPIARASSIIGATTTIPTVSADVHDALWFLTQQWRVGEFRGIDGGTLVKAKIETQSTYLNRFKAGRGMTGIVAEAFETNVPLEAKVERLPIAFDLGMQLELGYMWYKILVKKGQGTLYKYFVTQFPIVTSTGQTSDPISENVLSNSNSMQVRLLTSRQMADGGAFYKYLATNNASSVNGVSSDSSYDATAMDAAQQIFLDWVGSAYYQPSDSQSSSWDQQRMEYDFAVSAPLSAAANAAQTVLLGDKYTNGDLDWYSVDLDPNAADKLVESASQPVSNTDIDGHPVIDNPVVISYIPHTIEWKGMPTGRWWQFEDANMDLAKMLVQKQDITKLILMEFGLIYSNDWLLIPHQVDNGTITQINGLVVTDVFDQQILINKAGSNTDDSWQKWDMFEVNKQKENTGLGKLLMMPNIINRMESDPIEKVQFLRDDMAEMVWGVEDVVPNDLFGGVSGRDAYAALQKYLNVNTITTPPPSAASLRYKLNNTVPENWIPFVAVPNNGIVNRKQMVQRGAIVRYINGEEDTNTNDVITPRTNILSGPSPFYVDQEAVSSSGFTVFTNYKRTRWYDGTPYVWLGRKKQTGRGEADSGFKFDVLTDAQTTATPNRFNDFRNQLSIRNAIVNEDGSAVYDSLAQALRDSASFAFFPYAYSQDGTVLYGMDNRGYTVPFTFGRSGNAMVVDRDGRLKFAFMQNLITWSEDLTQVGFSNTNVVLSPQKIAENNTNGQHYAVKTVLASSSVQTGRTFSFSLDIQAAERSFAVVELDGAQSLVVQLDIALGQILQVQNNGYWTNPQVNIKSLTGGWYRLSIIATASAANNISVKIAPSPDNTFPASYQGVQSNGINVNRLQFKNEPSYDQYLKTTGTIYTVQCPRFDYDPNTKVMNGLMLEPASTNIFATSDGMTGWSADHLHASLSSVMSPFGRLASQMVAQTSPVQLDSYAATSMTIGKVYCLSGFFKAGNTNTVALFVADDQHRYGWFDVAAGTAGTSTNILDSSITPYGDGWYRCSIVFMATKATAYAGYNVVSGDGSNGYPVGDGVTPSMYIDCMQFEQSASASSFIPTYGTATTRNAETCVSQSDIVPYSSASLFMWGKIINPHHISQVTFIGRTQGYFWYVPAQDSYRAWDGVHNVQIPGTIAGDFNKVVTSYGSSGGLRTIANNSASGVAATSYDGSFGQGGVLKIISTYATSVYVKALLVIPQQISDAEMQMYTE